MSPIESSAPQSDTTQVAEHLAKVSLASVDSNDLLHEEVLSYPAPASALRHRVICIAIDGTDLADYALEYALQNVVSPPTPSGMKDEIVLLIIAGDIGIPLSPTHQDREAQERLEEASKLQSHEILRAAGRKVLERLPGSVLCRAIALRGDPREEIAEKVKELGADLLVVGSHGRGLVGRMFLGSVSDALVRTCDVPVLVARKVK
ncbi:hypothetical protein DFJ73DRAFT_623116 [Zopfochytrium polystomum]|nr:hypothetical protein DFJ73DRAFT_623116 [Zopfochytrium polystomum]